jgi:hypothetical protein
MNSFQSFNFSCGFLKTKLKVMIWDETSYVGGLLKIHKLIGTQAGIPVTWKTKS